MLAASHADTHTPRLLPLLQEKGCDVSFNCAFSILISVGCKCFQPAAYALLSAGCE